MRLLIFSLLVLAFATACSRATADLTVPARQTFLLGEASDYGYRASLRNTGSQTVTVVLRDKATDVAFQTVTLGPGESGALDVVASQEVIIDNENDGEARLFVQMSRSVQGMRYLETTDQAEPTQTVPTSDQDLRTEATEAGGDSDASAKALAVTLPQNQPYVIRQGFDKAYAVDLRVRRAGLQIRVRERISGRERESLEAARGTSWVYVRSGDELSLTATKEGSTKVVVTFDDAVAQVPAELGARR